MSQESARPLVQLFTDGACSGNPGPGGWAYILKHPKTETFKTQSGAETNTTNNRMELTAVIRGLEALQHPSCVEVITDSVYVGKGFAEWMPKWKRNGWRRREGGRLKALKNEDLWRRLDELMSRHRLKFTQVRGHSGHSENEECDRMAVEAYQRLQSAG